MDFINGWVGVSGVGQEKGKRLNKSRINLYYSKSGKNPHCLLKWFMSMHTRMSRNQFTKQCGFLPDLE